MRLLRLSIFTRVIRLICLIALFIPWLAGQEREADIVLHNGKILTVDSSFSTAEAVAIGGQQFIAVGQNQDVLKLAGPDTLVVDLKGKTVIPGLIDTHQHIHNYSEGAYGEELRPETLRRYPVDWRGVRSKEDVLNQIRGLMDKYQFRPGQWIYFQNQLQFINVVDSDATVTQVSILYNELNRWELDKVTPNNPVALSLGIPDFNGFLVNSKAMDILWEKYGDFIKEYGRYWVDDSGRPDGHLEPPANRLLLQYLPDPAPEDVAPIYKKYLEELAATGVTTVSTRLPRYSKGAYTLLDLRGELTLRIGGGMQDYFGAVTDLANGLKPFADEMGSGGDKLWVTSLAPTAVDGASTRACTDQRRLTAFGVIDRWWPLGQCHTDNEFRGASGRAAPIQGNYFRDWVFASARDGVRFANTHVAGDRSVGNLLSMIEQIQQQMGPAATKGWAFDHCVLVNPADFQRAARLGVTFSCAPKYIEDVAPAAAESYGEEVVNTFLVPVKSMLDAGIKVVYEADRDVYEWHDLELLLTRKDRNGKVWGPQERVDKTTVLKMVTRWAAEYVLKPEKLGSIEPGKLADLVVLDRDYMTIPAEEVSAIRPQMTVFDGEIIYIHPKFSQEYNLRPRGALIATYEDLIARRTSRRPVF